MNYFKIQKSTLAVDLISKQVTKDRKSFYFSRESSTDTY
jgi:hypothetical protein